MNQNAVKTPERIDLERRAQAALELRRRQLEQKTVYGIVSPKKGLLRCWQESNGKFHSVKKPPIVKIPEKLEPFLLKPKRFKVVYGGRGAGKSRGFGEIASAKAKDYGEKTLCLREIQNSIRDSVHAMLSGVIKSQGYPGFDVLDSAIRLNGDDAFLYRGMSRNPDAVKSMEGFKYSWFEEAQSASDVSLKKLTPTIRLAGSELWFSLNPESSEDPVYKRFITPFWDKLQKEGYYEDDLHLIICMNYYDNPWFPETLEEERLWDLENMPRAYYDHVWLGEVLEEAENPLIKREWFDACIDAHLKLGFQAKGARMASHDPSDMGNDSKGYAERHGSVLVDVQENESGDVNEGGDWASGIAIQSDVDEFTWDCDGMGVGLARQLSEAFEGKHVNLSMFKGSESPDFPEAIYQPAMKKEIQKPKKNKDVFRNKRAQYYGVLRDRIYNTFVAVTQSIYTNPDEMLSISSEIAIINKLRAELCRLPIKPNPNGFIELYTKKEMREKFKFPSPNLADSVMQLMRPPNMAKRHEHRPKKSRPMGRR